MEDTKKEEANEMVEIVRYGRIVQKKDSKGKIMEGSTFKTVEDAKRIERDLKSGKKKHVGTKG